MIFLPFRVHLCLKLICIPQTYVVKQVERNVMESAQALEVLAGVINLGQKVRNFFYKQSLISVETDFVNGENLESFSIIKLYFMWPIIS